MHENLDFLPILVKHEQAGCNRTVPIDRWQLSLDLKNDPELRERVEAVMRRERRRKRADFVRAAVEAYVEAAEQAFAGASSIAEKESGWPADPPTPRAPPAGRPPRRPGK